MDHTVKAFDSEIGQLRGLVAEMGGLAEVAIRDSIDALVRKGLIEHSGVELRVPVEADGAMARTWAGLKG